MYKHQHQIENLQRLLQPRKVVISYGASHAGKTTLVIKFWETSAEDTFKILFLNHCYEVFNIF